MIDLLRQALEDPHLVQSFSGVRTEFGESTSIRPEHAALAAAYGYFYAKSLGADGAPIVLARDPRPTGLALCQALVRGFLAGGYQNLIDLGIITTPLAQSAVRFFVAAGGVIVTASHNPLADNGWKFLSGIAGRNRGRSPEGALLSPEHMAGIVADVHRMASVGNAEAEAAIETVSADRAFKALLTSGSRRAHNRATEAYQTTIVNDWGLDVQRLRMRGLGPVLLDPNGGAACGLDSGVLEDMGVRVYETNAELSQPAHPIDTDGIDPETGEHVLMRLARATESCGAFFGLAFDYDADRGNVVLPGGTSASVILPQTISALNVALSLARWEIRGLGDRERWVVASDSTSRRVEAIADIFGARVAWVETGEVNVVRRIRELALSGAEVPVGVEGSNGGTIFAGSTCRDGVLTALSCALALAGDEAVDVWLRKAGKKRPPGPLQLAHLIDFLPQWSTPIDRIIGQPLPHSQIKGALEEVFVRDVWPEISSTYSCYRFTNYEGTREVAERSGEESGGWRVELFRDGARPFIFARGSRTEAGIWRIAADSPDSGEAEFLISLVRKLMASAGIAEAVSV